MGSGWVWNSSDTATEPYIPNTLYQYNSTGAENIVTPFGTGLYRVEFVGLGIEQPPYGIAHANAYGSSGVRCNLDSFAPSNGDMHVFVRCFNSDGDQVNSNFSVQYYQASRQNESFLNAYVLGLETDPQGMHIPGWQYHSLGETITYEKENIGFYIVHLPRISRDSGTMLIGSYGNSSNYCNSGGWGSVLGNQELGVRCFDSAGNAADTRFTLSFRTDLEFGKMLGETGMESSFLWAGRESNDSYEPHTEYSMNTASEEPTVIDRLDVGRYSVTIPGQIGENKTMALVSAYGDSHNCAIETWVGDSDPMQARVLVSCFDIAGDPIDGRFTLQYLTNKPTSPIEACDALDIPDYANGFSSSAGLNLLGSSTLEGSSLRLTAAEAWNTSSAWFCRKLDLAGGFETQFDFSISDPGGFDVGGADGLAFVIHSQDIQSIGNGGGSMGYGNISNSLAIEIDPWINPETLEDAQHIAIHSLGVSPNVPDSTSRLGYYAVAGDLKDGAVHTIKIQYYAGALRVFLDDLDTPVIIANVDLQNLPGGSILTQDGGAIIGFTSSTGAAFENHDILNWTYIEGFSNVSSESDETGPNDFRLDANYPNPFNPSTKITYNLYDNSVVKIKVSDQTGRLIETLVSGQKERGHHSVVFEAGDFPSGVYVYSLTANGRTEHRQMILMK